MSQVGADRFRVRLGPSGAENVLDVTVEQLDEFTSRLHVGDQVFRLVGAAHGAVHLVEVDGITHRVSRDEGGVLRSPAPALVVATRSRSARRSRPARPCSCSRA